MRSFVMITKVRTRQSEGIFRRELVELIAKAIVDHPDDVVVTQTQEGKNIRIQLHVAPSDMGKVIGKQGRIAKAIRSVVKAAASREDIRVDVDID